MRRLLAILVFASLASAILVGLHLYIARRLVLDPGLPEPWHTSLAVAIAVLGASLILQPFGERLLRPPLSRCIAWPASLWMGFAWLLLCGFAASDLVLWAVGSAALAAPDAVAAGGAPGLQAAVVAAVVLVAGGVGLRQALRTPGLKRVEIELERWPRALDGFRIVQISDLHIGPILGREFAQRVTERVNAVHPDLVAVTGDLVDGSVRKLADEVAPLAELRARHGVFFVTGNHDHYSGASAWAGRARQLGMQVLRNERVAIGANGGGFDLIGVDDHRGNVVGRDGREDLPRALAGRDAARPAVLLAHDPSTFKRASLAGIDLQLSGHTHGGQVWPFVYLVRLVVPFVAGLYAKNGSRLYVSRGTGFWGPAMRLRAPAEITEIVLRASGTDGLEAAAQRSEDAQGRRPRE